jgi:hypothetical protein
MVEGRKNHQNTRKRGNYVKGRSWMQFVDAVVFGIEGPWLLFIIAK